MPHSSRVCAVVVTFNRKNLLGECLRALQNQQRAVEHILVVNNASKDGTRDFLAAEFPDVEVLHLPKNGGGAGGFHAGMKHAFEAGFDWIWLMDDDGQPAFDCLQNLMCEVENDVEIAVVLPVQQDNLGRYYGIEREGRQIAPELVKSGETARGALLFTFVGPLLSRRVIERVGLPRREFFIWLDDFEYALRIHKHLDLTIAATPRALFSHDPGGIVKEVSFLGRKSLRAQQPAWKIYYGARNGLFIIARAHPNRGALLPFFRKELKLLIGDLVYEPERWKRVRMRLRGLRDGALGRLGKRV